MSALNQVAGNGVSKSEQDGNTQLPYLNHVIADGKDFWVINIPRENGGKPFGLGYSKLAMILKYAEHIKLLLPELEAKSNTKSLSKMKKDDIVAIAESEKARNEELAKQLAELRATVESLVNKQVF